VNILKTNHIRLYILFDTQQQQVVCCFERIVRCAQTIREFIIIIISIIIYLKNREPVDVARVSSVDLCYRLVHKLFCVRHKRCFFSSEKSGHLFGDFFFVLLFQFRRPFVVLMHSTYIRPSLLQVPRRERLPGQRCRCITYY